MLNNITNQSGLNNSNATLTPNCESVTLTKRSTENEIKTYFIALLKLSKSDDLFPANLDEVWMLVYSERSKAVRALKKNFIENEDYLPIAQNGERSDNGKFSNGVQTIYKLSLSCLEYFIARKVRPVFEVYRQVFHKTAMRSIAQGRKRTPALTTKVKASLLWIEGVSKTLNLNERTTSVKNPLKYLSISKVCVPLQCNTFL